MDGDFVAAFVMAKYWCEHHVAIIQKRDPSPPFCGHGQRHARADRGAAHGDKEGPVFFGEVISGGLQQCLKIPKGRYHPGGAVDEGLVRVHGTKFHRVDAEAIPRRDQIPLVWNRDHAGRVVLDIAVHLYAVLRRVATLVQHPQGLFPAQDVAVLGAPIGHRSIDECGGVQDAADRVVAVLPPAGLRRDRAEAIPGLQDPRLGGVAERLRDGLLLRLVDVARVVHRHGRWARIVQGVVVDAQVRRRCRRRRRRPRFVVATCVTCFAHAVAHGGVTCYAHAKTTTCL
mmetsp:Transcript_9136/g.24595  ORF Transcript_9136/g.24595 Transcript_9136/m.24595 type:complete len:286 (-) Transcript_9136:37-894(-)